MIKWPWKNSQPQVQTLEHWQAAISIPLLAPLSDEERQQLVTLADQFLKQKRLIPLQELVLTEIMQQRIALLFSCRCCRWEWMRWMASTKFWFTPPVYCRGRVARRHRARAYGENDTVGQSWDQGPIVLNWQEVQDSFDLSGFNLIIHEVAHKLDIRSSGEATGVPLIPLRDIAVWEQHLHGAMDALQEEIDLVGEEAASMDPYAVHDPAECFAVLSEYFFSAPELLDERFPDLYRCFQKFYRQDPLARLKSWQSSVNYRAPSIY